MFYLPFLEVSKTKIPIELDGKSFVESLKGDEKQINEYIYGVATRQNIRECKIFPSRMVRGSRFKLIRILILLRSSIQIWVTIQL